VLSELVKSARPGKQEPLGHPLSLPRRATSEPVTSGSPGRARLRLLDPPAGTAALHLYRCDPFLRVPAATGTAVWQSLASWCGGPVRY
jgi:hypothetical protein